MMTNVGNAALSMMYPILSAFIAYSIADRPGLMPGLMGGYLAQTGMTTAANSAGSPAGSGGLIAGFAAGLVVRLLNRLFRRIPGSGPHQDRAAGAAVELAFCRLADAYGRQPAAGAVQPLDVAGACQAAGAAAAWC